MQNNPNAYNEYDWSQNNEQLTRGVEPKQQISRGQKIAVTILAVFAFGIFFMWMTQFKQGLNGPVKNVAKKNTEESACEDGDCSKASEEALKKKDTDKDGLNDYDELNVYGTSPYLEDSDSDGYGDNSEVKNGKNPNCPQGQSCDGTETKESENTDDKKEDADALASQISRESLDGNTGASEATTQKNSVSTGLATGQGGGTAGNSSGDINAIQSAQSILNGQGDADGLRQLLLSSGMDPEDLNQISNEELMQTYNEILSSN